MLKKVISGGQTGIDQIGLKTAKMAKLKTGGTATKGYRTENGPRYQLKHLYGLIESWDWLYPTRTEQNVLDSNGTVIFGSTDETGTKLTVKLLKKHKKPYIINPDNSDVLIKFIKENNIEILNVAGNRGSKLTPFQRSHTGLLLLLTFKHFETNIKDNDTTINE